MRNVEVLDLAGTPMWDYITTYCEIFRRGSRIAASEYLRSDLVPDQLIRQIKDTGDQLIALNIK